MENLVIYRITNTKTGEVYIGQTRRGFARRMEGHMHAYRSGRKTNRMYADMRDLGLDTFTFEVICSALSVEHLDDLERHFIAEFDTYANGYNMTDGGDTMAPEALAKISKALTGRKPTWIAKGWITRRANGHGQTRGSIPAGESSRQAKSYLVQTPTGRLLAITGLKAFCREHGLTFKAMYDTLNGVQKQHKGYVLVSQLGVKTSDGVAKQTSSNILIGSFA